MLYNIQNKCINKPHENRLLQRELTSLTIIECILMLSHIYTGSSCLISFHHVHKKRCVRIVPSEQVTHNTDELTQMCTFPSLLGRLAMCWAVDRTLAAIQQTAQPRIKRTPAHLAFMPLRKNSVWSAWQNTHSHTCRDKSNLQREAYVCAVTFSEQTSWTFVRAARWGKKTDIAIFCGPMYCDNSNFSLDYFNRK